jgi:hypothetical protein
VFEDSGKTCEDRRKNIGIQFIRETSSGFRSDMRRFVTRCEFIAKKVVKTKATEPNEKLYFDLKCVQQFS